MILKQFFDPVSSSFTYILAKSKGKEAIIIDPLQDKVEEYLSFFKENDLKLVKGIDTHTHADHVSGLNTLRKLTKCMTIMGEKSKIGIVSMRVSDGEKIKIEDLTFDVLHTPGHTEDSYSLYIDGMLFTGDTLLIDGAGRTDLQDCSLPLLYHSLFKKILNYPDETIIQPGHGTKEKNVTTLGEQKKTNPHLQVQSEEEFSKTFECLSLPTPKLMDIVIPTNLSHGKELNDNILVDHLLETRDIIPMAEDPDVQFIDLREDSEIKKKGSIPGSMQVLFQNLESAIKDESSPLQKALKSEKIIIVYCANGERSAMAIEILTEHGITTCSHLKNGISDWIERGGPVVTEET
jgi:sulfur dioxygenase